MQIGGTKNQVVQIAEPKPTETSAEEKNSAKEENYIVINKAELKFANKKLGGKLKTVSEKQWEEQFGEEDFLKRHKKEYEFSFSKKMKSYMGS